MATKSHTGEALSFIQTLPLHEGRAALAHLHTWGDLPKRLIPSFKDFLRTRA